MLKLLKKNKIVVFSTITITIVLIMIIGINKLYCNTRKVNINNVDDVYINYYSYEDSEKPIITFKLESEETKQNLIKELNNHRFITYGTSPDGDGYEVVLNENTKICFGYEREYGKACWLKNNKEHCRTTVVSYGDRFHIEFPVDTALQIIDETEARLAKRIETFKSDKITMQKGDNILELNEVEREVLLRGFSTYIEIDDNLIDGELECIIDFNNGNKMQIYKNAKFNNFNPYKEVRFGKIINEEKSIIVQIPLNMLYCIN